MKILRIIRNLSLVISLFFVLVTLYFHLTGLVPCHLGGLILSGHTLTILDLIQNHIQALPCSTGIYIKIAVASFYIFIHLTLYLSHRENNPQK